MAAKKLTSVGIERLKPPAAGRVEVFDQEVRGFGARIASSGVKTLQVLVRINGRPKRVTLGRFKPGDGSLDQPAPLFPLGGYLGLAEGRRKAREIIGLARSGIDPEQAERDAMAAAARLRADTYGAVANEYIELYCKLRTKSWQTTASYLRNPTWDTRPLNSIARRDILAVLDERARNAGPYAANRWLAANRGLFNWALSRDYIAASPFVGVRPAIKEQPRERTLSPDEIARLWKAWKTESYPFGAALQLLLTTGLRRCEVTDLKWSEIRVKPLDPEPDGFTPVAWEIVLPPERCKNKKQHVVPLSDLAMEILSTIPRINGYVFAAGHSPGGIFRGKARADALCGVNGWRIHDLRRTVATGLIELGTPLSVVSAVLGHAERGVTSVHYVSYSYDRERRAALETWGRRLASIAGIAPADDGVIDLAERRAAR
jgi:integrase